MGEHRARRYDPEAMRRAADQLDAAADDVDRADLSLPEDVQAGVFAPHVEAHVNHAVANAAGLVLRLRDAATRLRGTADLHEGAERDNERTASGIGDDYMGTNPR